MFINFTIRSQIQSPIKPYYNKHGIDKQKTFKKAIENEIADFWYPDEISFYVSDEDIAKYGVLAVEMAVKNFGLPISNGIGCISGFWMPNPNWEYQEGLENPSDFWFKSTKYTKKMLSKLWKNPKKCVAFEATFINGEGT